MTEKQLHDILDNIRQQRWHSVALSFSMPVIELLLWSMQKFSVLSYARTIKFTQILFSISPFPIKTIRMINGYFPWAAEKQPLGKCFIKKVFLNISQNSQESTRTMLYFLIKLQGPPFIQITSRWLLLNSRKDWKILPFPCPHFFRSQQFSRWSLNVNILLKSAECENKTILMKPYLFSWRAKFIGFEQLLVTQIFVSSLKYLKHFLILRR